MPFTAEQILECNPCHAWPESRVRAAFGDRSVATFNEIANAIHEDDAVWVGLALLKDNTARREVCSQAMLSFLDAEHCDLVSPAIKAAAEVATGRAARQKWLDAARPLRQWSLGGPDCARNVLIAVDPHWSGYRADLAATVVWRVYDSLMGTPQDEDVAGFWLGTLRGELDG